MARLMVGLPALTGKLTSYVERFDMVELRPVDSSLPRAGTLARWRDEVPRLFAFSVVLPRAVADLAPGPAHDAALEESLEVARVLQANCIVLATPASVRPTKKSRDAVSRIAERLGGRGHLCVWDAAGLWEPQDFMETAHAAGLLPVFDAAQEPLPPGPVAYTRVRALGHAARLGAHRVAAIAEQLRERREAYVVADPAVAKKLKAGLASALAARGTKMRIPALFRPRPGVQQAALLEDEEQ